MDLLNIIICKNPHLSNKEISALAATEGISTTQDIVRARRVRLRKKFGNNFELYVPDKLTEECARLGVAPDQVISAWIKDGSTSIHLAGRPDHSNFFDEFLESVKKHAPAYPKIPKPKIREPHLFIFSPADIHIGKYTSREETGHDYDIEIATNRVLDATDSLLQQVSTYSIERIVLVGGNDAIHVDNPKNTTTSGTYQDVTGLWWELVEHAVKMYVKVIESLLAVAPVSVVWVPSNHDFTLGWCVGQILQAWFRRCQGVSFDCTINHRKYLTYGKNLIGFSHGDGARTADLPMLMASEAQDWSETVFRYWYLGHIHHKQRLNWMSTKDFIGVTVEFLRSPAESERWSHTNGFTGVPRAIEGFVHHPDLGQVSRHTRYF